VTHDRFMLERIATEFIGLDGRGGAKPYRTLDQFVRDIAGRDEAEQTAAAAAAAASKPAAQAAASTAPKRRKLSYKEQREFDGMEEAILEAEGEVERLDAIANDPAVIADHTRSTKAFAELSDAQNRVQTLYARWSELEAVQRGDD
jgi:ATP-binding cassette subfamily F protein uup